MVQSQIIQVGNLTISNDLPFTLIAGPCMLERRDHAFKMVEHIKTICDKLGISFIYKTSFDKANRTSISAKRGMSLDEALKIFDEIRKAFGCPILTDIHTAEQCEIVAPHVDVLQIPAFLCRQTDLLLAASNTGKAINVKKGQFLAPWDMKNVIEKLRSTGNNKIMACERGASFGYNTLVADMRSIPIMKEQTGAPIVFDATHAVQQPGGLGGASGGQREFGPVLARAALSLGIAALFTEVHDDPDHAPSDGPNMIRLEKLEDILKPLQLFDQLAKQHPIVLTNFA